MTTSETITLYYAPQTRASGTRMLLEELGAPYRLHVLNMKIGEQRQPAYLAINPMGKVPAIHHGSAFVTEQAAVYLYLADLFPQAGLAPPIGAPDRGAYLRWMVFYGNCFEPAIIDRHFKRTPGSENETPYSNYGTMLDTLEAALKPGPYLLGNRLSAADMLWGMALSWTLMFGLVEERPGFRAYMERIANRASVKKVHEEDAAMAAEHQAIADRVNSAA